MSDIYVTSPGGDTVAMSRVRCKNEERELQLILERNFDLLPGDQINPEDPRRWILIKREMPVPDPSSGADRWSIDFLFVDQDAMPTFVECKRFEDTRSRREVVGQLLEYAANGHHYWDSDLLRGFASEAAIQKGSTLDESIRLLRPPEEQTSEAFFDAVQENLRQGQLRIIFFLDEAPMELKSVVQFLNSQMERSEVLLVEARQYSHSGTRIVVPTLFGYTEEARQIKRTIAVARKGARRKWDRTSYFEDVGSRLAVDESALIADLLGHCNSLDCQITWGSGISRGSFNVKEPTACQRSILTVYSDGTLVLNYEWLGGSPEAERARTRLGELSQKLLGLPPPEKNRDKSLEFAEWNGKIEELKAVLETVVTESRDAAAEQNAAGDIPTVSVLGLA